MCLNINMARHYKKLPSGDPQPFVADRPLVVKKRVRVIDSTPFGRRFESPYQGTLIVLEHDYQNTLGVWYNKSVSRGFHAFLYNFTDKDMIGRPTLKGSDMKTIYGIIPEGAEYYVGMSGDVVTNRIRYYETLPELRKAMNIKALAPAQYGDYNGK